MTTAPARGIMLSIYVSMYHLPRVCRTLVPEIHVRPEILHVFRYIDMLTCVIYNSPMKQQGRLVLLMSTVKIIDKDR